MQNGLLLFKGRFYLGSNSPLKHLILHHVHASPMADHSGFLKSLHRAKREFYWKGMKSDIKQYIREWDVCQWIKTKTNAPTGLLQPLAIPNRPWSDVNLDFIEGLPKSQGYEVILVVVVVDWFTKYAHFMQLQCTFSKCLSYMAYLSLWLVIEMLFLLPNCGLSCFGCRVWSWPCLQLTNLNLMVKMRL